MKILDPLFKTEEESSRKKKMLENINDLKNMLRDAYIIE